MAMCKITSFHIFGLGNSDMIDEDNKARNRSILRNDPGPDTLQSYTVTECSLSKELLKPNEFTFTLRRDKRVDTPQAKQYTIVNSLFGKTVECKVDTTQGQTQDTSTLKFKGKIVSAILKGTNITCVAVSSDADLQGPPKCRCFHKKTLSGIITDVLTPYNLANSIQIHSCFNTIIFPCIIQYNENDYDFLIRLAKRFGAFFYSEYDNGGKGIKVYFGKPTSDQSRNIPKSSVGSVSYEVQPGDPNCVFVAHDEKTGLDLITRTRTDFDKVNSVKLFKMIASKSESLEAGQNPPINFDNLNSLPENPTNAFLDSYNKAMVGCVVSGLATCKFTSFLLDVEVGSVVKLNNDTGSMLVTSVQTTWDCEGAPKSEVTAIILPQDSLAKEDTFAPYMDINAYPKSNAQRAVVLDNVDPEMLGRVQVKFVWQPNPDDDAKKDFPWIRIAQPYGGDGKGCYILPEIGEEVMVGFEHDNMEKPFVIGTLFYGTPQQNPKQMPDQAWVETKAQPPGNATNVGNEVKAFRTKKGHTIEFHDVDGDQNYGYIRIYNKNKTKASDKCYEIVLSSEKIQVPNDNNSAKVDYQIKSAKDEDIEAGKDIAEKDEYKADKLRLLVRSNGGDIVLDAGTGDIIMNAKNIRVHASGDATTLIDQKNIMKVKGDQFVDVNNNSLVVQGDQTVLVKGKDTEEYKKTVSINTGTTTEGGDEGVFILDAKKPIHIHTEKELTVYSEQTIEVNSDDEVKLGANSMNTSINNKAIFKASDIDATATKGAAKITSQTGLTLDGGTQADLKAKTVTVDGEVSATLKGGKLDIQGTQSISATSGKITFTSTAGSLEGAWKWP